MSKQDYNTLRALKLHEIIGNERNKELVRQYAREHHDKFMRNFLHQLVGDA